MKVAEIYCNGILAGLLTEENRRSFIFRYEDSYFNDISNMFPGAYVSSHLSRTKIKSISTELSFDVLHFFFLRSNTII